MQKTPNFLTKNTISKILDENKQNKTKTLLSIQTTDENLYNSDLYPAFSPFYKERDNLGRLITLKSSHPKLPFSKNEEINKLIKINKDIHTKRHRLQRYSIHLFNDPFKIQIPKKPPLKKMTHINSDYLQNTLKNVLTYDKEIWQDSPLNSNTSPKNGNFGDRRFSLDFKKMIKNTPESLPHPFFQKKIKNCKIRSPLNDKIKFLSPPLGAYDVDQTKFAMQRSRECFINNAEVSSHDFYFKHILKIDNFAKTTKSFGLNEISEKVPVEALGQKIELNLKKNYQRNKNSILKELKKKELSLKLLNNYDANFWDRFLEGIRSTKEHIRKIRACSNNLGYSEVGKLSQILKNNML